MKLSKDKTQLVYNDFLTLDWNTREGVRLSAWESVSVGMGDKPVSRQDGQPERHRQRPKPCGRPAVHR